METSVQVDCGICSSAYRQKISSVVAEVLLSVYCNNQKKKSLENDR